LYSRLGPEFQPKRFFVHSGWHYGLIRTCNNLKFCGALFLINILSKNSIHHHVTLLGQAFASMVLFWIC
jgi:hypothetical protein